MTEVDVSRSLFPAVDVGRRLRRSGSRTTVRALGWYAQGVGWRGTLSYPEVRAMRAMLDWRMTRPEFAADPVTQVESVKFRRVDGQVRGEWVERPGVKTREDTVLLYLHGGAFVAGSTRSHRGLVSELSVRTGRSVFSVDYRLAPEYRFPAAADDVLRAYSWLLATGVPPDRIVVAGDSAGGHLALGLGPRAIRAGLAVPAGIVAFSPLVDPSMTLSAAREREHGGRGLAGADAGRAAIRQYHRGTPADHPELMLTRDDLTGMPPVLIQAGASEILAADAEHYTHQLRAAGGNAQLHLWPRRMHVFQVAHRISRSASEALYEVAHFVDRVAGTAAVNRAPVTVRSG